VRELSDTTTAFAEKKFRIRTAGEYAESERDGTNAIQTMVATVNATRLG
jgi:hypothetical protein